MSIVCAPVVVRSTVSTLYSTLSSNALRFVVCSIVCFVLQALLWYVTFRIYCTDKLQYRCYRSTIVVRIRYGNFIHIYWFLLYVEGRAIYRAMDQVLYTCGTSLQGLLLDCSGWADPPKVTTPFERVYCQQNLTCNDPVEVPYNSGGKIPMVCIHWACEQDQTEEGCYPLCDECKKKGKQPVFKRKKKFFAGTGSQ